MLKDEQQTLGLDARAPAASDAGIAKTRPYEPPRITALGTLAELTAGGEADEPDGHGGAGASGVM